MFAKELDSGTDKIVWSAKIKGPEASHFLHAILLLFVKTSLLAVYFLVNNRFSS